MKLDDVIFKRKSVRSYLDVAADSETIEKINSFIRGVRPLYPDIKISWEITKKENVKCILPWITPQVISVYSEDKEGMLENAGFIFQQLDLYMQSIGLGVCWLGMGRMKSEIPAGDNLRFVIMLAFGYPKGDALRSDIKEFKRCSLSEISDIPDERLEPARLAPSSINSQPWYFLHTDDVIHAYCVKKGFIMNKMTGYMNRIDMGICLAHMYVSNENTFEFFMYDNPPYKKGYEYVGSFKI